VTDHSATLGQPLHVVLAGSDPDVGAMLSYSATGVPLGATLDAASGAFDWTPDAGQAGTYVIDFAVSDGAAETHQSVLIRAAIAPELPRVSIELTPSFPAVPGQNVHIHVIASSLAPIAGLTLTVDNQPVTLDAQGRATLTPTSPGRMQLAATASDADG